MNGLARLLADLDQDDERPSSEGLPEAQIDRLREAAARIAAGNQFSVGDIVSVRADAPIKGAGKPRLIISIDRDAPRYQGGVGSWPYAARHDVTMLSVRDGDIVPHVAPFWMLEPYNGEAR